MAQRCRAFSGFMLFCLLIAGALATAAVAAPVKAQYAEAELVAEPAAIEAGKAFTAGLRLKLEPHWHVYWKNPGDAGLPVTLEWKLPEGFAAGPIQWPQPNRIAVEPLMNYGYEGEILLPVEIVPPAKAGSGAVELKAKAKWVICKEICLPGSAELSLSLPVAASGKLPPADPARTAMFNQARARLPLPSSPWTFSALASDSLITLVAKAPPGFKGAHPGFLFFPEEQEVLENAALQMFYPVAGGFALDLVRVPPEPGEDGKAEAGPDSLKGVAVSSRGWDAGADRQSVEIKVALTKGKGAPKALAAAIALGKPAAPGAGEGGQGGTPGSAGGLMKDGAEMAGSAGLESGPAGFYKLLFMLSFAFMGGLILNLMPCVLPVLSLKIFDFVKRSGESRIKIFMHGLVFTAGVLVSFWVLAGLLLILRQGGSELGWGFQLQSPSFLMVLCALFFFFSLNLFGVFELGYLFTRITAGQNTDGHMGSFMAGVTATVVATPCTAPFMGSAMGYAFSQPPAYALLVFTFLGLGMASPYLLLAGFPALMKFLPKPGEWMEHLKQFMGFPLLATAIWLAWVLGKQAGVDALIALLFVLLLAGLSAWILGKWTALHRTTPVRVVAGILALVIFLPAFVLVLMFVDQQRGVTASSAAKRSATAGMGSLPGEAQGIPWENFTPERLEALLAEGKPVFIDFTADWCLSCKVNERVALTKPEVVGKFRELGLTALKADWTLRDESIARALAKYGRNSIPLYVLYTGNGGEHVILPEIITAATVLEALGKVEVPAKSAIPSNGTVTGERIGTTTPAPNAYIPASPTASPAIRRLSLVRGLPWV